MTWSPTSSPAAPGIILRYLQEQNRPYSAQDVFGNLQKEHGLGKAVRHPHFGGAPSPLNSPTRLGSPFPCHQRKSDCLTLPSARRW